MTDINKKDVGNRIKIFRKELGLSMKEFGSRLDSKASDSIVSRWERGISLPSNDRLKNIAKLANISVEELLYGDERNYINPLITNIAANKYDITIGNDSDMVNHIFNRLNSYSYDSTEASLYSENKDIFDGILLYPFDMDSNGLIRTATLDLSRSINKIKKLTENRKDDLSKKEYKDLTHTKDIITEILQQAYYDIDGMDVDSHFSSVNKYEKELQKEIDDNANSEILDPKIPGTE